MIQCPSCGTTLLQDFGMVTCQNCQAVLMIDYSGRVQVNSENPVNESHESEETAFSAEAEVAEFPEAIGEGEEAFTEEPVFDEPTQSTSIEEVVEEFGFSSPLEEDVSAEETHIQEPEPLENSAIFDEPQIDSVDDEAVEDETEELAEPLDQVVTFKEEPIEEEDFSMVTDPDSEPVDITSFANSEESNLDEGEFLYDVTVSRLDSKDLKEELKYVLMDEKLKLNYHSYIKKIKDGKVVISDLNPIKAKRIIEQLQYLSVTVRWKQKRVIMELDSSEEDQEGEGFGEEANA